MYILLKKESLKQNISDILYFKQIEKITRDLIDLHLL
jgi:hypothetical protein